MPAPSPADRSFLERRRATLHVGLYVLPGLLVAVLAAWVALFTWWPLAINPVHAAVHWEGLPFPRGTVTTYAITVTVLLNALLLVSSVAVSFALLSARRERRYLRLLARLSEPARPDAPAAAAVPVAGKDSETRR